MKQLVFAWAFCLLAALLGLTAFADELPDGVQPESLDAPAVQAIPAPQPGSPNPQQQAQSGDEPVIPAVPQIQTFEDPGAVDLPAAEARAVAPQTGDDATWLALSGMGLSALALAVARRMKNG